MSTLFTPSDSLPHLPPPFSFHTSFLHTQLPFTLSLLLTTTTLCYPPSTPLLRKLALLVLLTPLSWAFLHHLEFTPWYEVSDLFGRFCYIWGAHLGWVIGGAGYAPVPVRRKKGKTVRKERKGDGGGMEDGKKKGGKEDREDEDQKKGKVEEDEFEEFLDFRERLRQMWAVLFSRHYIGTRPVIFDVDILTTSPHDTNSTLIASTSTAGSTCIYSTAYPTVHLSTTHSPPRNPHTLTCRVFLIHHTHNLLLYTTILYIWHTFYPTALLTSPTTSTYLIALDVTSHYLIYNLLVYTATYSFFALFFVGVFHDNHLAWSTNIFGPPSSATSVRNYWGRHWHDFVGASFSGLVKCVTRGWLRMGRGRLRRVLENVGVFWGSGLGHGAVRWVQDPRGDFAAIILWYIGQMAPILVEDIFGRWWVEWKRRIRLEEWVGRWTGERERGPKLVRVMESCIGYTWVLAWFFWSVPLYVRVRDRWTEEKLRRRYPDMAWE